jgi:cobalt/nickel transport protein
MSKKEIIIGLVIALTIAIFLSPLASSWPDGLEKVAHDYGFIAKGEKNSILKSPIPDYAFPGIKNEKMATAISGLFGTVVIFGIGYGLACLLKKRRDCK